jgi:glycosyltransferase involved in cell wall biosynthesis
MSKLDLVVPGELVTRTGGYIYDRRIVEGMSARGWRITVHALDMSFPLPTPCALHEAQRALMRIPSGRRVVLDGLALGGMPALIETEADRLRLIALIHHPLALETGLETDTVLRLREAEKRALDATYRVITTSATTAHNLALYGVPLERLSVVNPGTDPAPLAAGSGSDSLHLLCVAALIPRKGHALLIEALNRLRNKAWRLSCVGSATRDPVTALALRLQIAALGLSDRITLTGELDDDVLADCYHRADAFVLASHHEGYGMAYAEALARGLPVVGTRAGAIPETVPSSAGLLVAPGDVGALAEALHLLLVDHELRARLRAGARVARNRLPSWEQACAGFAAALAHTVSA